MELRDMMSPVEKLPAAKDELFDAYLEGNLRVPQTDIGIEVSLANALIADPAFDLRAFVRSVLTDKQLARMKTAMNNAHASHGVHLFSEDIPSETFKQARPSFHAAAHDKEPAHISRERLGLLWLQSKLGALLLMARAAELSEENVECLYQQQIREGVGENKERWLSGVLPGVRYLQDRFADPEVRARTAAILKAFSGVFDTPEGLQIEREIKKAATSDKSKKERGIAVQQCARKMQKLMLEAASSQGFHLGNALRGWSGEGEY